MRSQFKKLAISSEAVIQPVMDPGFFGRRGERRYFPYSGKWY